MTKNHSFLLKEKRLTDKKLRENEVKAFVFTNVFYKY